MLAGLSSIADIELAATKSPLRTAPDQALVYEVATIQVHSR